MQIFDANGCRVVRGITIDQPPLLSVNPTLSAEPLCNGDSNGSAVGVTSGGTPGYSFEWDNGETTAIATNLTTGIHTITVTDANNCVATGAITLTEPPLLVADAIQDSEVLCVGQSDGTATVSASGGTTTDTFEWLSLIHI